MEGGERGYVMVIVVVVLEGEVAVKLLCSEVVGGGGQWKIKG